MGNSYKIKHDRQNCIGCGACAVIADKFWQMNDDGKSDLLESEKLPNGWHERRITPKDYDINLEAAQSCPVEVIHIEEEETGEKVI